MVVKARAQVATVVESSRGGLRDWLSRDQWDWVERCEREGDHSLLAVGMVFFDGVSKPCKVAMLWGVEGGRMVLTTLTDREERNEGRVRAKLAVMLCWRELERLLGMKLNREDAVAAIRDVM